MMIKKGTKMTKFDKTLFNYSGGFLTYGGYPERPKFIARFKYRSTPITKGVFVTQLIKNHSVEEYFAKLDAGSAPLEILRDADPKWYETRIEKFKAKFA
jgi:hypothetical protein